MMSAASVTFQKNGHLYHSNGKKVPLSVSAVLRLSGICADYPDSPIVRAHVQHAGELGETVHEWCDYLDQGETDVSVLDGTEPLPYVLAYQKFRQECEPIWEHLEQPFADEALGVAGTPDRIGTIQFGQKRTLVIGDIKSPRKAEKHWGIQLSAYEFLSRRHDCELFAIHLASDASYKLLPYQSEIEVFLAAVKVAQWRVGNGVKNKER